MARVKANLLDNEEVPVGTLEVESRETYGLNGYFKSPDGGLYLICEVKPGVPPIDVELTGIWIDGTEPSSSVG
jgi:hypothetical protein